MNRHSKIIWAAITGMAAVAATPDSASAQGRGGYGNRGGINIGGNNPGEGININRGGVSIGNPADNGRSSINFGEGGVSVGPNYNNPDNYRPGGMLDPRYNNPANRAYYNDPNADNRIYDQPYETTRPYAQQRPINEASRDEAYYGRTNSLQNLLGLERGDTRAHAQVQASSTNFTAARIAANNEARAYFAGSPFRSNMNDTAARNLAREQYGFAIRNGFAANPVGVFTQEWWANHPQAWGYSWGTYPGWSNLFGYGYTGAGFGFGSVWPWRASSWANVTSAQPSIWGEPIYYDYGQNVYYLNGTVYMDGQATVSEREYAAQARRLALSGSSAISSPDLWQPLGVFAIADQNGADPTMYLQLAFSRNNDIGGNFYNSLTNETLPVRGHVDAQTQRTAWIVGSDTQTVYETGLYNLTQPETSMLAHAGADHTLVLFLTRMNAPVTVQTSAQPARTISP